jgi:hypothetical protein
VQRTARNICDLRPFLDTGDSDEIDTSDVLPIPQLLSSLYRRLAVTRLKLVNCADVDDRSAERTKRRR